MKVNTAPKWYVCQIKGKQHFCSVRTSLSNPFSMYVRADILGIGGYSLQREELLREVTEEERQAIAVLQFMLSCESD